MSLRESIERIEEYDRHRQFLIAQSERSAGVSPDEAAKRRQTAQRLGVSTQAVNDAPENAVLQEQLDKIWRDTQGLGTLRGKMTDADFYDVAKDDTGALSVVGELANSAGRGFFKGLNNLAAAATDRKTFDAGVKHLIRAMPLGRDLGGLADMYNSVLIPPTKDKLQAGNLPALPKLNIPAASDLIPEDVLRRFNERRAKDYVGFDNWTNKHFSPSARLQKDREGFAKTEGFGDAAAYILTHPYMTANVSAESFGQFVPALAATAATRNPAVGAAVMGTGSFATEYAATLAETAEENAAKLSGLGREEALARVLSDPAILDAAREKAAKRGLAVGLFDGMTAGLAGRLLSGARSVSGAAARTAGEAGVQMAGGAAGEAAAQAVTGEWTPREIVMEAFAEIPTAPVEGYRNFQEGRLKAKEAQEHARHMQQQADAVASSKLTARAPDLQADFINESYGEENSRLFFDAQTLMQSGLAETVAQAVPHLAPQIEAAAASGGMVEMTRGDFHAFLPQEAQHHLASIARLSPDAFSAAEAQAWEESEAAAEFEDMAKRAQEDAAAALRERQAFDALKAQFKGELLDTGRMDAKGADDAASLWASHVQAYAGRLNLSPEAFMERYGRLNVVGDSLTREGVFSQALASAPPKGWVHSTNPQDVIGLWDDTTSARAIFWTGIDNQVAVEAAEASDYSHSISADVVRHIKNRHGNDADGQLPVTAEDLVKIPEIIANYDEVRTNLQNPKTGGQRVAYAKRSKDSLLIYLEEYVRSGNNLKGVSMWKYPPTADVGNVLAHITRPSLYVQNGVAAYDNTTADTGSNQDVLFQAATEEARQFEEVAAQYGGEEAYEQAKADGETVLTYRQWVQVRTPAFKEWFGDWENDPKNASKVVNPNTGEPLVVYHGTAADFDVFDGGLSGSKSNTGAPENSFFFTDVSEVASSYTVEYQGDFSTRYLNGGNVMPVFLNIRKPLKANAKGKNWRDIEYKGEWTDTNGLAEKSLQGKTDGVIVKKVNDRGRGSVSAKHSTVFIAHTPNQIKSATANSGAFSADNDSILHQDARGMFDRMGNTIALLKDADASTFIHEFGHFELEVMSRIERDLRAVPASEMTEGERQVLADFQTALDWFGVKDADTWAAMSLEEQREHHEKFARGMEAYLFEGTAPSEALRGVFSRVARLLKRIYRTLAGLNVELSDDIREVFGRLLASDEQIAEAEYVNGMKLLLDEDGELRAMDEAARREAEDELGRRALRDMAFSRNARSREIRRLKKEYKADFARAEMDARRSIMRQPVYRAWQLFTAKMTDEDRIDGNSKEEREFRRKAKVLQGKPVYTIETRRSPSNFKELRAWASQVFAEAGNKAVNPEIGEIVFNDKSVKDSVAHSMNPFKAAAFEAVPDVIRSGVVVAQAEHGAMRSHYISAPVKIEGVEDIVTVLVREDVNSRRMYLHSVITKEKLLNAGDTETADVGRETGQVNSGVLPTTQDSIADTDVSQPHGKLQSEDVASVLRSYLKYKPKTDRTALDPSSDTLMTAIAKLGGLNKDELVREWGLDAKDKIPAPVFGMPVLRRSKGRSIDEMAELLAEEGYLPTDNGKADVRDLEERFSDGLSGRDWYSRHYVPREEKKAGEDVINPFALNAVRLDEDSLSGLPADWAQVLQERGMTAKTGGMHPDIAAGLILDENGEPVFSDGLSGRDWYSRHYVPREEKKAGEDVINPFALNAVRLDEDSLSGLPADWAQVLQERGMTAKTGGMHPDIAAGLILDENGEPGFSDGLDLAQALAEALPPQEEIERTAMLNLLAEKGEVPTRADFEEAADLAVHNEMRARLIAGELNRLKASLGSVSLLKQAARVAAKERVEQMKTRDLRPSVFTRAEAAAAKSSEKAFKAGNIEEAAAHKRNQLIQNALARETLKAREEMEKTRRYLAKFDRVAKGVDIEYREQIEALLEDVELRQISLKETDRRKSAYQFVREMEEAGIQHSIDPEYVDTISRKSWREMTVEEMRGLADTVRQLEHLGRLKNKLLSGQEKRSYQEVRDELAGVLEESAKAQGRKAKVRREAATRWEKSAQSLSGVWWGHLKISTIARIFDDGKDNGAFFRHFILPLKQAADREATMTAEAAEKLYAVLQPLSRHAGRLKGMLVQKQDYQGLGRLTREQLFAVALNMGNAGNLQRLLDGSGWHLADVERAVSTLTAEEWHAVQGVWDFLESYRPQIAALERRMTGVEPDWVQARPFKIMSADGVEVEMRGGYYPAKYDREGSGAAEKNEATTDAKAQTAAAGLAAATRRTFTKQRVNEVKGRPLRLSLTVAYDAVNEIIHDLTHREAVADANRLLNSHTLDTLIRQHYGAAAKRQLTEAVKDIAAGNSGAAQALDTISARLRQNVSVAGLGFNVTSAAMQLTGIVPAMTRLGAGYTAKAMMTYFAHPVASTRGANELSEMMVNRTRTRFRELNEVANSVNGSDGIIRRYAYWMMMRMQQIVDTIVWHGALMKAQDAGMTQEDAVQVADQTVLDTQGGGQAKDLSALERGGATAKLFTVFYSYMNTALNMGAATAMTERSKGKMAAHLLLQWVVPTALTALFKSMITPGDDDDDLAKKLAKEQISFMLGMFVGGRELAQMGDIATGGKFYGYSGPSGVRPIADTYKLAVQAKQGEFDKGLATATINILGSVFGLPSAQISRTIKGAQALEDDKTDNPAALLFGYDGKK
nr:MAG TPA: crystallin beta/gamma motif-containing protein [Caudoviricetes sp.]